VARRMGRVMVAVALVGGGLLTGVAPAAAAVGCGSTITTDTTLTSDLSCPGDALVVTAPGVTLDLGGHLLRGAGFAADGAGIRVLASGVAVRNGRIENFRYGVDLVGGGADVTRLFLHDNGDGARVGSSSNRLHGNLFTANSSSVLMRGSGNLVEGNSFLENDSGIFVVGSGNDVLRNNIVGEDGDDSGILTLGQSTRIVGNRVSHYRGVAGIAAIGSAEVSGNQVFSNIEGIVVLGSATVVGNTTFLNSDDGIDVRPGASAALRDNTATQNGDLGIEASGMVTDGGGNRASGNGNPLQCLGVVCG
jgi:parallel beta-helix repeat protein